MAEALRVEFNSMVEEIIRMLREFQEQLDQIPDDQTSQSIDNKKSLLECYHGCKRIRASSPRIEKDTLYSIFEE